MQKDKHTQIHTGTVDPSLLPLLLQGLIQKTFSDWEPCLWEIMGFSKIKNGFKSSAEFGPQKLKYTLSTVTLTPNFKSNTHQAIALLFLYGAGVKNINMLPLFSTFNPRLTNCFTNINYLNLEEPLRGAYYYNTPFTNE